MERDEWQLRPNHHQENVLIEPGLSHEAQFFQWLGDLNVTCKSHSHTRLRIHKDPSRDASLPQPPPTGEHFDYHLEQKVRRHNEHLGASIAQGLYPFTAVASCPACKLEHAQVPREFCESTFDSFIASSPEQQHNLTRCREFVAQVDKTRAGFLVMVGMPGNGKTRLACNILYSCCCNYNLYLTQATLLTEHRKTYRTHVHYKPDTMPDDDDDQPKTVWRNAEEADVLILDEIGTQAIPPGEMLLVDHLLKYRYDRRKATILISNLPLNNPSPERLGFKDFVGDALFDRIRCATGNSKYVLQFSGESFRRRQGENYLTNVR